MPDCNVFMNHLLYFDADRVPSPLGCQLSRTVVGVPQPENYLQIKFCWNSRRIYVKYYA